MEVAAAHPEVDPWITAAHPADKADLLLPGTKETNTITTALATMAATKATVQETAAMEAPSTPQVSPDAIGRQFAKLEGELAELRAGARASDVELRRLIDENINLKRELDAKPNISAAFTPPPLSQLLGSSAGGSMGVTPGINSKPLGVPKDLPKDMPPLQGWQVAPAKHGLEKATLPDFVGAWTSRPRSKAASKQLTSKLTSESMLDRIPKYGDISAYKIVRGPMLERWFLFSNVIHDGGEAGETALLRALVECATNCYNSSKADGATESHWRGLMEVKSVLAFLEELDGMFLDRSHTASEQEWELAQANATDAFDLYMRIRHLLNNGDTRIRGFNMLVKYLISRGDRNGVLRLQECGTEDPSLWHAVLDSLRAVDSQIPSSAAESSSKGRRAATPTPGGNLLGMSGSKTQTKTTEDNTKFTNGGIFLDAETDLDETLILTKTLLDFRAAQGKNEQQLAELKKQLAALAAASNNNNTPPPPSASDRFKAFAPSYQGGPAKVHDLTSIYEFLGLGSDLPPRRGNHPGGTHGDDCKVCSKYLGFTQFQSYDTLQGQGPAGNARAYHNAWKCSKIPQAVRMQAEKDGTPQAKVDELLKLIDDPFWKPRGA